MTDDEFNAALNNLFTDMFKVYELARESGRDDLMDTLATSLDYIGYPFPGGINWDDVEWFFPDEGSNK